jgi:hypothetical protein
LLPQFCFAAVVSVPPFRYFILTHEFIDPAHLRLQVLFSEMLLSPRKACDPQPFTDVWKCWQGRLIDVKKQQDAFEFLEVFLSGVPSHM